MNRIPVNMPVLDGNEKKYLMECIETGWISSEGPFVAKFEDTLATRLGRKFAVAVSSGTAALDIAVAALGLKENDEVILPSFTIISCATAIVRAGLIPVVVDCDPITWNLDVNQLEGKISEKTRAIMVVHIYGLPVDMAPVLSLARKHNLFVIEDAAEAIGQTYQGKPCGSFGDISIFSFYPNKHITTGEGGMIFSDDPGIANRCKSLRNLCFQADRRFVHNELGWNYRMTNLQAALGIAQAERLDNILSKKRWIGRHYNELLSENTDIQLPLEKTSFARNLYWVYSIVLTDNIPFDATEIMLRLKKRGVDCRPFFWPIHQQPVFRNMGLFAEDVLPVSERVARRGFYIPSGLALTEQQLIIVAASIKESLQ
jgi:perosamine synthetase